MRTRYVSLGEEAYLFKRTLLFAVIFTGELVDNKHSELFQLTQSLQENIASWVSGRVEIR